MPTKSSSRSSKLVSDALAGLNRNLDLYALQKLLWNVVLTSDEGIANLRRLHPKSTHRYSNERILRLRDELRYLWNPKRVPNSIRSVVEDFPEEHRSGMLPEMLVNAWLRTDKEGKGPLFILFDREGAVQIKPNESSLPSMLAFGAAHYAHHLRFCENKNCPHHFYFIADRVDQKYCSSECALPAQRAAKRKWWRAHSPKPAQLKKRKAKNRREKHHGVSKG